MIVTPDSDWREVGQGGMVRVLTVDLPDEGRLIVQVEHAGDGIAWRVQDAFCDFMECGESASLADACWRASVVLYRAGAGTAHERMAVARRLAEEA